MKGGAVKEDKSPEKDAIDLRNDDQLPRWDAGTASTGCSVIIPVVLMVLMVLSEYPVIYAC
jgi:hypothetical protein